MIRVLYLYIDGRLGFKQECKKNKKKIMYKNELPSCSVIRTSGVKNSKMYNIPTLNDKNQLSPMTTYGHILS